MSQSFDYVGLLTNTIEMLSMELYRMKNLTKVAQVSAHDSLFNNKLECMFKSFKNVDKFETFEDSEYSSNNSLSRVVRAISKLQNQSKIKIKSSSKPRNSSTSKESFEGKPKLFMIGGGKVQSMKTPSKKPQTKLTYCRSFIKPEQGFLNNIEVDLPNHRAALQKSAIPKVKKAGLKQPTKITPSKSKDLWSSRNYETREDPLSMKHNTNIVTFTPSKLDRPFNFSYKDAVSCKGSSTCAFSDSKSYQSSQN